MKTLNLELSLDCLDGERPTPAKLWENFLVVGLRSTNPTGLDIKGQIRLMKTLSKLDRANGSLELEDAEFDLFKEVADKAKFDPAYCRLAAQFAQRIEEVK